MMLSLVMGGGARDPNDPELYDVIIGNVEGARDH